MEKLGKNVLSLTTLLRLLDGKSTPQERLFSIAKVCLNTFWQNVYGKKMFGKQYYLNAQKIPSEIEGCSCSKKMSLKCNY